MQKVGILGGGQLGKMLLQAAANYPVETFVLEKDAHCPAAHMCHHFVLGDITKYDDVVAFGKNLNAITIEIENVNINALEFLEQNGVLVVPSTRALKTIANKISQKQFYVNHQIPTAPFIITNNSEETGKQKQFLPAVHKLATGGYDGKGVQVLNTENDLPNAFDSLSLLEKKIDVKKEIALIIAVSTTNQMAIYTATEMIFDPVYNLLDYQVAPANLPKEVLWKAEAIALAVTKNLHSAGLFAIELFVDKNDEVWVNETAPRVHNSGHHTIEATACSQFDMLWRILLQYPLGNTATLHNSALVNLVGAANYRGKPIYQNIEKALQTQGVFVHIYGKQQTQPGRKMGHITIIGKDDVDVMHKANSIKNQVMVLA